MLPGLRPLQPQTVPRTVCKTASAPGSGAAVNICSAGYLLRPFAPETFPRKISTRASRQKYRLIRTALSLNVSP